MFRYRFWIDDLVNLWPLVGLLALVTSVFGTFTLPKHVDALSDFELYFWIAVIAISWIIAFGVALVALLYASGIL